MTSRDMVLAAAGASAAYTWTKQMGFYYALGSFYTPYALAGDTSTLLAVGNSSRGATTTNLVSWTSRASALISAVGTVTLYSASSGMGYLLAAGQSGKCGYSADNGATWTNNSSFTSAIGSTANVFGIAYSSSLTKFVAVGYTTVPVGATTTNGTSWSAIGGNFSSTMGSFNPPRAISWGPIPSGSGYCCVGYAKFLTSPDGVTWTSRTAFGAIFPGEPRALTYNGTVWTVVGDSGLCVTSADGGATWTSRTSAVTAAAGAAYQILAVTSKGSEIMMFNTNLDALVSNDNGATWTKLPDFKTAWSGGSVDYPRAAYVYSGKYVVVGGTGTDICVTSS